MHDDDADDLNLEEIAAIMDAVARKLAEQPTFDAPFTLTAEPVAPTESQDDLFSREAPPHDDDSPA